MTSSAPKRVYVWGWLPGLNDPVVIGVCAASASGRVSFRYAQSYRRRPDAMSIGPDLRLSESTLTPPEGHDLAGTLRDALPDGWGQRVILNRITGTHGHRADPGDLGVTTSMVESDSNRFGALDFQESATEYRHRGETATLDQLRRAAELIDAGAELPESLESAAAHGTSIGGARPKAQLTAADGSQWIAKFESRTDILPTVQAEFAALDLAKQLGISVPRHQLVRSAGKYVLLVERFDRSVSTRRQAISLLTALGLTEMNGRYATYPEFLDLLDGKVGEELFVRVALNIALGNTDDHARNHAAFWDGSALTLAPVYDIDPTARPGGYEASQAIAFGRENQRRSRLLDLHSCAHSYGLSAATAYSLLESLVAVVDSGWAEAADRAELTTKQTQMIRQRCVLRELALDGMAHHRPPRADFHDGPDVAGRDSAIE